MVLLPLLPLLHGAIAAQSETGERVKNLKCVYEMMATGDRTNCISRNKSGLQVHQLEGF